MLQFDAHLGLLLAGPILVAMAFYDLRFMQIPKWVSGGLIAIFVVVGLTVLPWPEIGARIAVAGGVFVAGFAAFALRLLGGGDVKALSALMLLIPMSDMTLFMLAFAACLMLGVAAVLAVRYRFGRADAGWAFLRSTGFPMGLSIAGAGLVLPVAALFA